MTAEEKTGKARKPRSRERGKGRYNKGTTRVQVQLSMQPEERDRLRELSEKSGKTLSGFILDNVLGERNG